MKRKLVFLVLVICLLISFRKPALASEISVSVNASVITSDQVINIQGEISSGEGQIITVKVEGPSGEIDYLDQAISGPLGKYQFVYMYDKDNAGEYKVYVSGRRVEKISTTTFEIEDTTPPATPQRVTVISKTETTIGLGWEPSTDNVGVVGYEIYIDGDFVEEVALPNYTIADLEVDRTYSITIKAKDAAGNLSIDSEMIEVKTNSNIDTVRNLISEYVKLKEISTPLEKQLITSLDQAEHHLQKGSLGQAIKHMEDFNKHINNDALSKFISQHVREKLLRYSHELIEIWNSGK